MATTKTVFFLLWIIFVLPLIFFNLKKIYIRREGEKPKLNLLAVSIIAILTVLITLILLRTYTITINYQPVLVADRFINTMSSSNYEESEKDFKKLVINESTEISIESDIKEIFSAIPEKGGRYQLGTIIRAKYFYDKEFFPSENIDKNQNDVVCVMVRIDNNKESYEHFILRMRKTDNISWRIDAIMKASEEAVTYAEKFDLINKEHGGTWYKF